MPPSTRRSGPPAGGFQQLEPEKRKRNITPAQTSQPALSVVPEQREVPSQVRYEDKSTQVASGDLPVPVAPRAPQAPQAPQALQDAYTPCPQPRRAGLTENNLARTPSRKRSLDDASDEERSIKRINSESRSRFFGHNRERSAILSKRPVSTMSSRRKAQSARKPLPIDNPFDIEAALVSKPVPQEQRIQKTEQNVRVDTPAPRQPSGWFNSFNTVTDSVKKILWGNAGSHNNQKTTESVPQQQDTNPFEPTTLPRHATREQIQAARNNKKTASRSKTSTYIQPTVEDEHQEQSEAEANTFETTQVPGTNKRKMDATEQPPAKKARIFNADENGNITGTFGLTDDMLEYSDTEEEDDEIEETQPKSTSIFGPPQPRDDILINFEPKFTKYHRAQMKAQERPPVKKVSWAVDPNRPKCYGNLGPAGQYTGTMFNFDSHDESESTTAETTTNTYENTTNGQETANLYNTHDGRPVIEKIKGTLKTPPQKVVITNPDGHFSVPYSDDSDSPTTLPEDTPLQQPTTGPSPTDMNPYRQRVHALTPITERTEPSPEMPHAPKIPHAALPGSEERLNKARQESERYKPKQSSRLSNVEPARSRSSSPPPINGLATPNTEERTAEAERWAQGLNLPDPEPYRDHEQEQAMREAEEWAAEEASKWPEPQLYTDTGYCSQYIDGLIRERWTKEDDEQAHAFYDRSFRETDEYIKAMKAQGREVILTYD